METMKCVNAIAWTDGGVMVVAIWAGRCCFSATVSAGLQVKDGRCWGKDRGDIASDE